MLLGLPPAAHAQADVFSRLEGRWTGSGELMGQNAYFEMTWRGTGWGAATLSFANGFVAADGRRTPVLSATALYSTSQTMAEATWLDSRGQRLNITWEANATTLTSHWRAASEQGRTEYVVVSADEVRVTDYVQTDGAWREFGSATYSRAGASATGDVDPALAPLAWLAGCWRMAAGDRVTDEQWMAPLGNAMLGVSRSIRAGRLTSFEHLRIEVRDGRATYIALPSGQAETAFPAILVSDTAAAFENPTHDFPQRVGYRPAGTDSIAAWIEGQSGGAMRRVPFGFRRIACGG